MFDRILIPLDGSPCSAEALEQGLQLARHLGAQVRFLHSLEPPPYVPYAAPDGVPYYLEYLKNAREIGNGILREAQQRADVLDVVSDTRLVENKHPVDAIVEAAYECDLVVIGTHGRRGLDRFFLGSVTEGVLRRAEKPHFVVRCKTAHRKESP
jgi:nucleotide-binding universal stress UspA family protein